MHRKKRQRRLRLALLPDAGSAPSGRRAPCSDNLPSFSAQIEIAQIINTVTSYQYFFYNGCKINKLMISAELAGKPFFRARHPWRFACAA